MVTLSMISITVGIPSLDEVQDFVLMELLPDSIMILVHIVGHGLVMVSIMVQMTVVLHKNYIVEMELLVQELDIITRNSVTMEMRWIMMPVAISVI